MQEFLECSVTQNAGLCCESLWLAAGEVHTLNSFSLGYELLDFSPHTTPSLWDIVKMLSNVLTLHQKCMKNLIDLNCYQLAVFWTLKTFANLCHISYFGESYHFPFKVMFTIDFSFCRYDILCGGHSSCPIILSDFIRKMVTVFSVSSEIIPWLFCPLNCKCIELY